MKSQSKTTISEQPILQERLFTDEVRGAYERLKSAREVVERLRSTLTTLEAESEELKQQSPTLEAEIPNLLADGQDPGPTESSLKDARDREAMIKQRIDGIKAAMPSKADAETLAGIALRTAIREALTPVKAEYQIALDAKLTEAKDLFNGWMAAVESFHQGLGVQLSGPGESPDEGKRAVGLQAREHPFLQNLFPRI